jgi:hypothetical protein
MYWEEYLYAAAANKGNDAEAVHGDQEAESPA